MEVNNMVHGTVLHISSLKVGDVVRAIPGMSTFVPGAEALFFPEDYDKPQSERRRVTATAGWRSPRIGGEQDFRQGYDAMTVYRVTEDFVTFVRPYFHIYPVSNPARETLAIGVENVNQVPRNHSGHWYELL